MSKIIREANRVVLIPGKDIVASMKDEFAAELEVLAQESSCDLTIDLTGVDTIDSVGIGIIIVTNNSLKDNGNKLKIININDDIYDLFRTMRLDRHLTIERTG